MERSLRNIPHRLRNIPHLLRATGSKDLAPGSPQRKSSRNENCCSDDRWFILRTQ
jgi:hypothetical protein